MKGPVKNVESRSNGSVVLEINKKRYDGGNTGHTSPYGFHDWKFILTESGLIRYDHVLANFLYKVGTIVFKFRTPKQNEETVSIGSEYQNNGVFCLRESLQVILPVLPGFPLSRE